MPDVDRIDSTTDAAEIEAQASPEQELDGLRRIVPEYTTPDGVNPRMLRRLIASAMAEYADLVPGYLPDALVRERRLPAVGDALRQAHDPAPEADIEAVRAGSDAAHERLVLEELYLLELGLAIAPRPPAGVDRDSPPGVVGAREAGTSEICLSLSPKPSVGRGERFVATWAASRP